MVNFAIKRVVDLTHHLCPEKEQRRLILKATRTLDTSFANEYALEMHAHIGTHVEGPYHCLKDGKRIDELPPERFVGEALVMDLTHKRDEDRAITKDDLERSGGSIKEGDIVLLKTGYDGRFPSEEMQSEGYKARSPYLTYEAVKWLIGKKMKLLGIDFWSIEEFPIDPKIGEPRHIMLFEHEIPLIHSLVDLTKMEEERVFFAALPLPISGLDSSPVRAVALELADPEQQ